MKKHEIVMYGWAFCPPHMDHTGPNGIVATLLHGVAEKVIIIPTGKREDKSYDWTNDVDRENMLKLAVEDFGSRVEIDTTFLYGDTNTTTLLQASYLRNKYGREIPQVFGSDVAKNMMRWDKSGFVARELPKIFVRRPGFEIDSIEVANFDTIDFASNGFSSTEVRREVARILGWEWKIDSIQNMIQKRVMHYIFENKLFETL
jgi:nicotinic acid mononucleotide adenylyltransferase